jgi:diguanylate cyclase (GGDEF)-like protein
MYRGNDVGKENGRAILNKCEIVTNNFLWITMLFLILSDIFLRYTTGYTVFQSSIFIIHIISFILILINAIVKIYFGKRQLKPRALYSVMKILDILLLTTVLSTSRYGHFFYFAVLLPIIGICTTSGFTRSLPYLGFGFFSHILLHIFVIKYNIVDFSGPKYYYTIVIVYFLFIVFLAIIGDYHSQCKQKEQENMEHVRRLEKKYAQLEEAEKEKQEQYDKMKEVNLQLEDTNKKLTASLAEFFTLHQISQAISSIFDMNELLQFVNDIIIGVMGVSTSNIVLYSGERLKVQVSNILSKKERAILTDNINTPMLKEAVEKGHIILNNSVNPDEYDFTKGRDIKSLLCVPLKVKGKSHGLVLIEHSIPGAFDEDNVRLLEIITQQISIAIENTSLYEKLQESANTDGLTQINNRVFFQRRLSNELEQAQQLGYEVSVILYDIDDFKKFNDTYGHLFGDIVLKTIAQMVKESIRKDDLVARFGGEEFIIMLPHTGKEAAYEKAEDLRRRIAQLIIQDGEVSASVTVSMGVSTFPSLAKTELTLLNSADEALYQAKKSGKNCVKIAKKFE